MSATASLTPRDLIREIRKFRHTPHPSDVVPDFAHTDDQALQLLANLRHEIYESYERLAMEAVSMANGALLRLETLRDAVTDLDFSFGRAQTPEIQAALDKALAFDLETDLIAVDRSQFEMLRHYAGSQTFMSDFQSADGMRAALNEANAEVKRLNDLLFAQSVDRVTHMDEAALAADIPGNTPRHQHTALEIVKKIRRHDYSDSFIGLDLTNEEAELLILRYGEEARKQVQSIISRESYDEANRLRAKLDLAIAAIEQARRDGWNACHLIETTLGASIPATNVVVATAKINEGLQRFLQEHHWNTPDYSGAVTPSPTSLIENAMLYAQLQEDVRTWCRAEIEDLYKQHHSFGTDRPITYEAATYWRESLERIIAKVTPDVTLSSKGITP